MTAVVDVTGGPAVLQVLLVEDDPADATLIEDAFVAHALPAGLHHVPDGVEAMAFLRREEAHADAPRPDLILLDLNMPRMSGQEVLAAVKTDEQLKAIPVIVFTTSAVDTDVLASYSAHANAYVTKPMDLDSFGRVIAEIHRFYGRTVALPPPPPTE
ncbi:response regulator [Micromonospora acroterricola]|uniref:Response regulator n=1 Tax=Micromonospora acroterricola TaxID=2202421 RepID=A0A317DES3_9ACTN|nr:response regulator [Micromonospora acroterricola]PWR11223.1 response regulator [Micromonospora acroterricola]